MSEKLESAQRERENSPMPAIAEPETAMDVAAAFETHHAMVFRAACRVTGNTGDAEDVLQTVFLRLLSRPSEAEAVENLASYLRRAAVNAALDIVRARQTGPQAALEELQPPADRSPGADRMVASAEAREWLRAAVARLSPQAAEIFALRFYEGYENPEVARMLGTTEGTVAVTVSRARERIQREYEAYVGRKDGVGGKHAPRK